MFGLEPYYLDKQGFTDSDFIQYWIGINNFRFCDHIQYNVDDWDFCLVEEIFREGLLFLIENIRHPGFQVAGFTLIEGRRCLHNVISLDNLKNELENLKANDPESLPAKELEIAKKIQEVVKSYPYTTGQNSYIPSSLVEYKKLNCLGASILGYVLLEHVGIKSLHLTIPGHSVMLLITSDEKIYWQDFTSGGTILNYRLLTDNDIVIPNKNDSATKSILNLLNSETPSTLSLIVKGFWYNLNRQSLFIKNRGIVVSSPFLGLLCNVLSNIANKFLAEDLDKSIYIYKLIIQRNPGFEHVFSSLGYAYFKKGLKKSAIEAYECALQINPQNKDTYKDIKILKGLY